MATFEFTAFIKINAKNYETAIEAFDWNLKHGNINRRDVYVAEIEEIE